MSPWYRSNRDDSWASVTDNSSLYSCVSFTIHQLIQGDQDISRSEILSESSDFFERYFDAFPCVIASLHSFQQFHNSFTTVFHTFPNVSQEFPSSKVRFKLRGFLLGEASTSTVALFSSAPSTGVGAAADWCGAPMAPSWAVRIFGDA